MKLSESDVTDIHLQALVEFDDDPHKIQLIGGAV